jgi:hypothetical protein
LEEIQEAEIYDSSNNNPATISKINSVSSNGLSPVKEDNPIKTIYNFYSG